MVDWVIQIFKYRNIVPGTVLFLILPYFYFVMFRPENNLSDIQEKIRLKIESLGRITKREVYLSCVLLFGLVFWVFGAALEIPATFVAMFSLFVLITIKVIDWNDVINNSKAWDSYFWLALMIKISQQISDSGIAAGFGDFCASTIMAIQLSGTGASFLLAIIYFLTMYLFSSITAYDLFTNSI